MKPVCVKCKLFFKPKKTGIAFEEGMPTGDPPNKWKPYKLWAGDLYECRGCGAQLVAGVPRDPIAEHYQPDYAQKVERFNPIILVEDC